MAAIINFISTAMLTIALGFGQLAPAEIVDANRVDIHSWSTGGAPAEVVCTKEEGGEWSVFLGVTQEMGPNEIAVEGRVKNIEMTMTLSFEADDEAIMNMITLARQQGANVEVS